MGIRRYAPWAMTAQPERKMSSRNLFIGSKNKHKANTVQKYGLPENNEEFEFLFVKNR